MRTGAWAKRTREGSEALCLSISGKWDLMPVETRSREGVATLCFPVRTVAKPPSPSRSSTSYICQPTTNIFLLEIRIFIL